MVRAPLWAAMLTVLVACGGGGGGTGSGASQLPPPPAEPPAGPTVAERLAEDLADLPLDEFFGRSFKALQQRDPESVVADALTEAFPISETGLSDLSDGYRRDTFAMVEVILTALAAYDRSALAPDEQISYDTYRWYLRDRLRGRRFMYHDFLATYGNFGTPRQTELFFSDLHPLENRRDALAYIERLGDVEAKFGQLADYLRRQRDAGIVEPALTLGVAINQVRAVADVTPNLTPYYTSFRERLGAIPGLSESERETLLAGARDAIRTSVLPGYRLLLAMLEQLQAVAPSSIGVGQYPEGRDFYDYALRHHTTSDLTAMEIHQLGLDELERIHHEMRLIFDELGYPQDETLEQLYARVATDGGTVPAGEAVATFRSLIDFAEAGLPEAFDLFPMAEVVVIGGEFGGFYVSPSFDGERPGAFYAGTSADLPYFNMPSLAFHEAVPGHHYQIALARELDLPLFRKLLHFTGYIEGWALYAERLARELGWYEDDPYGALGQLQYEALRAARLVMDTGIHRLGWSFDQAVRFNRENVGASLASSQGAAGRYSVSPGQASAYMVGMLEIVALRERAENALGNRFDLAQFHRVVIGNGAMPLTVLKRVVNDYIERRAVETG